MKNRNREPSVSARISASVDHFSVTFFFTDPKIKHSFIDPPGGSVFLARRPSWRETNPYMKSPIISPVLESGAPPLYCRARPFLTRGQNRENRPTVQAQTKPRIPGLAQNPCQTAEEPQRKKGD